jgi:hypothetical protein
MKESRKRRGEACASRRLGQRLLGVPLPPGGRAVARSQERATPTPGLLRISYLVFAFLAAAAAVAAGSAKAITASPSSKL